MFFFIYIGYAIKSEFLYGADIVAGNKIADRWSAFLYFFTQELCSRLDLNFSFFLYCNVLSLLIKSFYQVTTE
jgi:hypothetical protein